MACLGGGLRDPAALTELQAMIPEVWTGLFSLITRLGNPVGVAAIAFAIYLLAPRRPEITRTAAAHLLAVVIGGIALITATKFGLACPRPPATLHRIPADGFGFPSGHATAAAVGYGSIAVLLPWQSRRGAVAIATALSGLVAVSRVGLGVHYPIDVLAGLALGGVYVWLMTRTTAEQPLRAFGIAGVVGVVAGLVAWPTLDGSAALGGPLGAMIGWTAIRNRSTSADWLWLAVLGLVAVGLVGVAVTVVVTSPGLRVGVFALAGAGLVALPGLPAALAQHAGEWPH